MKVLHVSSDPLPDIRVERAAWSARNRGIDVSFAGGPAYSFHLGISPFESTYILDWNAWSRLHLPGAWRKVRRHLTDIVTMLRPDIIHAHNVIAARLALETGLPMIYDDHEYWSMMMRAESEGWVSKIISHPDKARSIFADRYGASLWSLWESRIVKTVPTIAVSDTTARAHAQKGGPVFVVPNLPNESEIEHIAHSQARTSRFSIVLVGRDLTGPMAIRDSRKVLALFSEDSCGELTVVGDAALTSTRNVMSIGVIPHLEMLRELTAHDVGLIAWRPHWFHRFCSPNKAYLYMHCGLIPVVPNTLRPVLALAGGHARAFSSYEDLARILRSLSASLEVVRESKMRVLEYARANLRWEQFEAGIFEAYARASVAR